MINSFCHRDFTKQENNKIAIFSDRIEIFNPGQFPYGFKPEDFINGHEESILRNPLIARILYYSKDIEKWGSGLKRINDECYKKSIIVKFNVLKSGFKVVFYRKSSSEKSSV